jgi:CDP-glycerol glycerophosphotransferase (TagB/SpsB family)
MYLFFVRAFNDIDHITPIVWKMSMDKHPVSVYCIDPEYDIDNDYRLNFLREQGVKVDFIYNDFDQCLGFFHGAIRFLFLRSFAAARRLNFYGGKEWTFLPKVFGRLARGMGSWFYILAKGRYYDQNWAQRFVEQSGAQVLCFDWIRPRKYVVDMLLRSAKEMSIPTVALPHGVFLYTNDLVQSESKEEGQFERYNHYDYVVVQNKLFKEIISKSGVNEKKIFVLGSTRYCNEWMAQNKKILPRKMKLNGDNSGRLKVVFMTTRPHYRIHVEKTLRTFEILGNLDKVQVVVKPHTRTGKEAEMYKGLPLANVSDISSVELSEWADVMLVVGSSIIIEALTRHKPALYLKYLHENTTEYEEFGACWIIRDEDELRDALLSLRDKQGHVPYTDENVNRWLAEVIYGGQNKRDVLRDYEEFIVNWVAS